MTTTGRVLAAGVLTVSAVLIAAPSAQAENGDTHITGQGVTRTMDCNNATLIVVGTGNYINALGTCWAVTVQGSSNVTHGCINLSTDNAKSYYDTAIYGDPVEVTGTPIKLSARDGDIWDWTLSWDQWKGLSALT